MNDYLQWIVDAWNQLPMDTIVGSFKGCGLTTALDGSDDDQIHCFKPDGPIQNGCELLQQKRAEVEMIDLIEQVYIEEEEEAFGYDSDESVDFEIV